MIKLRTSGMARAKIKIFKRDFHYKLVCISNIQVSLRGRKKNPRSLKVRSRI